MKSLFKKSLALMTAALLCAVMVLTSCAGGEKEYKVTVKDANGAPFTSGIVVQFMKDGVKAGMQACNENGEAAVTLPSAEYTVELTFTDSEAAYYYTQGQTVSASAPELEIIMANTITTEPQSINVQGKDYDAYDISDGCTYVELDTADRNYFLYTPKTAGNYKFSIVEGTADIGYHGAPHFVQEQNLAEVVDGAFNISIKSSMIGSGGGGTSVYVLGVDAVDGSEYCVISIERIGDPVKTIEDEPWTVYQKTAELKEYTLPEGAAIGEFDLTAATDKYSLVYNETDGFYHLNSADGPLVLVRLAEDCDYIACFKTMLDRSGVVKYFYDESDNFVKKESYSECLLEYIEYVDENEGVYPLTEDLKYIIQQRGDHAGWWNKDSNTYIFKDETGNNDMSINVDLAWLLMCCYIEG